MRYIATKSFTYADANGNGEITRGVDILDGTHELVRLFPDNFKPLAEAPPKPDVEDATAAPGRKRGDRGRSVGE
jgi:hypothetical protein